MISLQRYLRMVKSKSGMLHKAQNAALTDIEEPMNALQVFLPSEEKMAKIRTSMEAFRLDPAKGRAGLLLIYPLSKFREVIDSVDSQGFDLDNWFYDRVTGYVLVNMGVGSHEAVAAALAQLYAPDTSKDIPGIKEMGLLAEVFTERGFGWKCSAGTYGRILRAKHVKMTAQEKMVFRDFTFMDF